MDEKLTKLYTECLHDLKTIGIYFNNNQEIGTIYISITNRKTKRYGCCKQKDPDKEYKVLEKRGNRRIIKYEKYNKHYIEISRWVMELNDEVIKNTIFHEMIHCIPFCNNHGTNFKKYAKYINEKLGYDIKRVGNPKEDFKKSNLIYQDKTPEYKYKIICESCKQEIYRQRFNTKLISKYRCGKCGGRIKLYQ